MDFISLFAGVGGFDLGLERAGLRCVAQVEWDKAASAVLAHHYPNVQRFGDVRDVRKRNLPAVDLVVGGFPCQDVSVAGRRAGLAGERSGLWFEFHRILAELKPRIAVIENVPGLLSSNGGRDFAVILRGLEECGYCVAWRTLDAQYFGVAQRRRRVFIVASLGNGRCAEILFERESSTGDFEPSAAAGEGTADPTVSGTLSSSGAGTARTGNARSEADMLIIANTLTTKEGLRSLRGDGADNLIISTFSMQRSDEYREASVASTLASRQYKSATDLIAFSAGQSAKAGGIAASEHVSPTLKGASSGTNQVPAIAFNWYAGGSQGFAAAKDIAPTLQVSDGHAPAVQQAQMGVRRLTPTECERLQGFPDGWTAVNNQSDSVRYRQLGNAVCVNVSEWIGRRIAQFAA